MPTEEEIYEKVKVTLVDALGVDDDEVTLDAVLISDLGAESIDFLDIVFRLEKNFAIKIPRGELFPEQVFNDPEMIKDGMVTSKGLEELRNRMPHLDLEKFEENPSVQQISNFFTVETIVKYLQAKLS